MFKQSAIAIATLALTLPANAQEIGRNQQEITAYISPSQGHLIDWSKTDRRIERIFIDNPEQFKESFVFATDGCAKDKCSPSTSMINLGSRGGSDRIRRGSIKVVLRDRRGGKSVVAIRVVAVPWSIEDPITTVR